jgi:hypothetical protein
MKVASNFRQQRQYSRHASAQALAGPTAAPSDFENLVQRFIAYKPEHQFKVLSARLKSHQVRVMRQSATRTMHSS